MIRLSALFRLPSKVKRRARRHRMATLLLLCFLLLLLLLPFYIIYRPPRLLIRYFQHRWPDVLWEVSIPHSSSKPNGGDKYIALTIDDAPSEHTRAILQVLEDSDAHATMFVIGGQVEGREDVLREVVAQGNELGNHAMHDEAARGLDLDVLEGQIERVQGLIRQAYADAGRPEGPRHQYFRPGSGIFSTEMRAMVSRLGYRLVLGSVYPHDPQVPYWWLNAWHILSMARDGGIIVCHDRRSWTIPMLKKVLPELKRRGYKVVTVSELLDAASRRAE
ncbi:family 4 carbohydrate esterase [Cryphonectria parasitica EP155]|uniref:chitin deacetylase n=1 Tax=Cryphonectria parasitica (strain ATCC 38755 / EP155) TaxID=660469 RepID=A0A9P5CP41_CRYP1|nr:family 4 carbohydrate esterase [Cryphonectria parasitica EP155]KAF3764781.1 family 4 carbohydrate esterase [Cryphonectria parasitica EP155]